MIWRLHSILCEFCFPIETKQLISAVRLLKEVHFSSSGQTQPVPPIAILALITAEDRRFYKHYGFDIIAILRCIFQYIMFKKHSGGSTIDQQFVRTVTRRYDRTLFRKIREIILSIYLQRIASKEEIAAMYLLVAYLGWRMNGYLQACRRHSIRASKINETEAAFIVASLKYPIPKSPSAAFQNRHEQRVRYILKNLNTEAL